MYCVKPSYYRQNYIFHIQTPAAVNRVKQLLSDKPDVVSDFKYFISKVLTIH